MRRHPTTRWTLAGALLAVPLLASAPALARHKHGHAGGEQDGRVNSAAYPKAPGGTPASENRGKPVQPKPDAAAKPGAPSEASSESAPAKTGTPSAAYPGAPGGTPSASDGGKPVKP